MRLIFRWGSPANRDMFTGLALEADVLAVFRNGAMGTLGGQFDFLRGSFNLHRPEVQIALGVYPEGHRFFSTGGADCPSGRFSQGPLEKSANCPCASASYFLLGSKVAGFVRWRSSLPYTPDGLYHFGRPLTFVASKAVILGDARDSALTDPKKILMKLDVNWGHEWAQQLKRV